MKKTTRVARGRRPVAVPSRVRHRAGRVRSTRARDSREWLALAKRGQVFGFVALILMLGTIVTLASVGQPKIAGAVAGGLVMIVALFITGRYRP